MKRDGCLGKGRVKGRCRRTQGGEVESKSSPLRCPLDTSVSTGPDLLCRKDIITCTHRCSVLSFPKTSLRGKYWCSKILFCNSSAQKEGV